MGSIEADSRHYYDDGDQWYLVNTDKFGEFTKEHNNIQATETNEISVQVNINAELKNVDMEEYYTKDIWIPMTTVYGVKGMKMFMKNKMIEVVYAHEGSNAEIQQI